MSHPTPVQVVEAFWAAMASNDFDAPSVWMDVAFVIEWPQSNERIRGAANFGRMNREYPSYGPWRFNVNRIVGSATDAVSDVSVTDGVQHGRAISFFTIAEGRIVRIVEFWPDPFPAPANRAHLVEHLAP